MDREVRSAMIISTLKLGDEICDLIREKTGEDIAAYGSPAQIPAETLALADVMISKDEQLPADMLDQCVSLRLLYVMSAGVDHLPFEQLHRRGITVCNASGIHGEQMAEHALGVMIAFSRQLGSSIRNQSRRLWKIPDGLDELSDKTLCIIGAGRIGRRIAEAASVFGMRVIGLKRKPEPLPGFERIYDMSRLHEALSDSDYVILLTPLTPETVNLMGAPEFAAMKKTAVFLNLSRGETVDEDALIAALKRGQIAGAGLDVFRREPLPPESKLWGMENVIVTPHIAGMTRNYVARSINHFIKNLLLFRNGQPPLSPVDLIRRY